MAKNKGGYRVGAVKGATQYLIDGKWCVINVNTGKIYIRSKPVKGVRKR